jgi:uncharacterized protein involved in exopolysaccharide biosynthesis
MTKRPGSTFLSLLPLGIVAGLSLSALATYLMPKTFESNAIIELKPHRNAPVESVPENGESTTPAWVAAEIEVIKSHVILDKVSQNLELPLRWKLAKEEVPPILKNKLLIQCIRGSDLVSIRAQHTNKVDARDIALEVAKVYQSYRNDFVKQDWDRSIFELQKTVREQEKKVEERRKVLSAIVRTGGNIQLEDESGYEVETLLHVKPPQDFIDAKREFEADEGLLEKIKHKLVIEGINSKILMNQVEIRDLPVIGESPVSPNWTQNLWLGFLLGLLLTPLMAFLHRRNPMNPATYAFTTKEIQ